MAAKWNQAPQLQATIRRPEDRKLVVGTDGKGIGSTGLYYRDRSWGKARLYAYPVNAAGVPLQWGITVSNPSADKKVTVKATKEGKLNPTLFSYSAASQAVMDYMSYRGEGRTLEVPAGQTVWLDAVRLEPGQGAVQLADIETDGDAIVSFAAAKPEDSALQAVGYPAPKRRMRQEERIDPPIMHGKRKPATRCSAICANGRSAKAPWSPRCRVWMPWRERSSPPAPPKEATIRCD
ncbi:hypothetical protein LJK87_10605 [Paenibacillus sp. P25]|nr:hypothetical protein LJK87_10605 [Paenibacillus sp. P25]